MDGGQEIARGFIVARGDGAELFDFGEEIFNQVTGPVHVLIERARLDPVGLAWNHHRLAGGGQRFDDAFIRIERFVSDQ